LSQKWIPCKNGYFDPQNLFLGPGGWIKVKYRCFSSKKLSKMKSELILKVELEVEVGVFSLHIKYTYKIKLWRGPQAAQNTLGPPNNFF